MGRMTDRPPAAMPAAAVRPEHCHRWPRSTTKAPPGAAAQRHHRRTRQPPSARQNWRPFQSDQREPSTANMRPRRRLPASVPQPSDGALRRAIARDSHACSTGGASATEFRAIWDVGRMVTADPYAASGAGSSVVSAGLRACSRLVTVCPMPDLSVTPGVSRAAVSRAASRPMDPSACRTRASRASSLSHRCAAVSGTVWRMNA